jgi:hypothetical protein
MTCIYRTFVEVYSKGLVNRGKNIASTKKKKKKSLGEWAVAPTRALVGRLCISFLFVRASRSAAEEPPQAQVCRTLVQKLFYEIKKGFNRM